MNKTWIGLLIGLILPVLTSIAFYKLAYHGELEFFDFLKAMVGIRGAALLVAISCLPNLAAFSIFVNTEKIVIGRGVFLATIFYGLVILVLKFII
ncbi:MAG: hypothetical protein II951_03880 [Bacteroidales bacterium]|jgi:hypothetical protein|nr:hypothetical protein [Bacteroidales bacterium]